MDSDVGVKPLHGRQEGAGIGYNPPKPGRPTHVYHNNSEANLRISLGVEVRPGNEHAGATCLLNLWRTLEKVPRHHCPPSCAATADLERLPLVSTGPCRLMANLTALFCN